MYALFTPLFRQSFEIPLDYATILQSNIIDTISTEERGQEWRNDPVPAHVVLAPALASPDAIEQFDLDFPESDELEASHVNIDQAPLALENYWSQSEAATVSVSSPLFVIGQTCSACERPFEKTKSHKGTRCWACKKRNSRRLPPEVSITELSVNDCMFF